MQLPKLLELPSRIDNGRAIDPFPGLRESAREALREVGVDASDRIRVAKALESYLKRPGRFTYTLVRTGPLAKDVDPIEDFVVRQRHGHCEYFASALALMLRSQGIPCRVVIGFRAGDWNSIGKFYKIRQLHAHTWVEVYLEKKDLRGVPQELGVGGDHGGWLLLDPTPSADLPPISAVTGVLAGFGELVAYTELLWANYVLGLNQQKQHDSIYAPLARSAADAVRGMLDAKSWQRRFGRALDVARKGLWAWLEGNWFSWRGGLAAMVLCLTLVGIFQVFRALGRWLVRWAERHRRAVVGRDPRGVRFYGRLESLLRRQGVVRNAGETQHEFAMVAGGHLAEFPSTQPAAFLPRQIVDAFYRVRFGHERLDRQEAEIVERALVELETALRMRNRS